MTNKNKGNLKSNLSKLGMEESLLKLMQSEKYQEITIQEITDHAQLSRRTFYRNYSSKDEILEGRFIRIWSEYRELLRDQSQLDLPAIARVFFTQMLKYKDFLVLANRHHLLPLFQAKADEWLPSLFYEVKGDGTPFPPETIQYALTFSTGGFVHLLIRWLNDDCRRTPDEMASIIKDFISISAYNGE